MKFDVIVCCPKTSGFFFLVWLDNALFGGKGHHTPKPKFSRLEMSLISSKSQFRIVYSIASTSIPLGSHELSQPGMKRILSFSPERWYQNYSVIVLPDYQLSKRYWVVTPQTQPSL